LIAGSNLHAELAGLLADQIQDERSPSNNDNVQESMSITQVENNNGLLPLNRQANAMFITSADEYAIEQENISVQEDRTEVTHRVSNENIPLQLSSGTSAISSETTDTSEEDNLFESDVASVLSEFVEEVDEGVRSPSSAGEVLSLPFSLDSSTLVVETNGNVNPYENEELAGSIAAVSTLTELSATQYSPAINCPIPCSHEQAASTSNIPLTLCQHCLTSHSTSFDSHGITIHSNLAPLHPPQLPSPPSLSTSHETNDELEQD